MGAEQKTSFHKGSPPYMDISKSVIKKNVPKSSQNISFKCIIQSLSAHEGAISLLSLAGSLEELVVPGDSSQSSWRLWKP